MDVFCASFYPYESEIGTELSPNGKYKLIYSVPPRYAPSEVMKAIEGKTAEIIFREFPRLRKKYWWQHFWARGYFVSTVGIDEEIIKAYIRNQEYINSKEQMKFWK